MGFKSRIQALAWVHNYWNTGSKRVETMYHDMLWDPLGAPEIGFALGTAE